MYLKCYYYKTGMVEIITLVCILRVDYTIKKFLNGFDNKI